MRLRPFISDKDFLEIKNWITEERAHAMWCANYIQYPLEKEDFDRIMLDFAMQYGDSPYVATTDDGKMIGFFCYSVDLQTNIGKFKFVMVAPAMRGKGIGKEMLQLAVQYAFDITKADAVQLNVYPINTGAKRCYEKVGFVELIKTYTKDCEAHLDEKPQWAKELFNKRYSIEL